MLPDFIKFSKSLRYAINGIRIAFQENNFRIQFLVALLTVPAGLFFKISKSEWICILLCIGIVLAAEIFNTAIEKLCDHLHPEYHTTIGKVKDLSAAAVLVCAVIALVIGVIIFGKYLFQLLNILPTVD